MLNNFNILVSILFFFNFLFANYVDPKNIRIIATTNVNGETEPCGWPKKPLGGLARKATIVDNAKVDSESVLIFDAGNLFFKKKTLTEMELEEKQINAKCINDSYNLIGCNAFTPGEQDFAAGLNFLLSLKEKSNYPFISCNIKDKQGSLIFEPYIIIDADDLKIGVIGLSSIYSNPDIVIDNPISSLENYIYDLEMKTDLIILLFHGSEPDLKRLEASKINSIDSPIDLIIQSKNTKRSTNGGENNIPTFSCGKRGKYLYQFDINILDLNKDIVDLSSYEGKIKVADRRLNRLKKGNFIDPLENIYKDDPKTLNLISSLRSQIDKAQDQIDNTINVITHKEIPLDKNIVDRPDILKIIDLSKEKINKNIAPQPAIPFNIPKKIN